MLCFCCADLFARTVERTERWDELPSTIGNQFVALDHTCPIAQWGKSGGVDCTRYRAPNVRQGQLSGPHNDENTVKGVSSGTGRFGIRNPI